MMVGFYQGVSINITPGVCGKPSHDTMFESNESGMAEIDGITYCWHGGCPMCVEERLIALRSDNNTQ